MNRREVLALAGMATLFGGAPALAQDKYPSKPVKIIIPYAPGGATDIVARLVADQLRAKFNQSFVVENKPGAFGILALEEMARARPDGYTLMIGNTTTNAITPVVFAKRMKIEYLRDVTPVARLADLPSFFVSITKDFPPKTYPEYVTYAKARPGKILYGSAGVGSIPHYTNEVLAKQAGIELVHVPNKAGAAGFVKDLLAGDVHVATLNVATAAPHIRNGLLRALAIDSEQRLPEWPDVPSLREYGYPGTGGTHWQAMFAPAATPRAVLETIHQAAGEALKSPTVQEAFKKSVIRAIPTASLEEEKEWINKEMGIWRRITDDVKVELTE
jgi:tripartite-type tricarboxylate transporter receptor subunit TctC